LHEVIQVKILLRDIPQGHSRISRAITPQSLGLAEWTTPTGEIEVDLDLDRREQQVTIRGEARLIAHDTCARCLEECSFEMVADLMVFADRRGSDDPKDEDALEREGSVLYHEGLELDLGPSIREALILEVPKVIVCKPECQGLCAECGQNLNESSCNCTPTKSDPRWEALKAFKTEESPGEG
jgi:uncharacterized protein